MTLLTRQTIRVQLLFQEHDTAMLLFDSPVPSRNQNMDNPAWADKYDDQQSYEF